MSLLYLDATNHDIYTVNGITTRTLRLDFTRNYNVLSFRHNVSQQYLMVCWLWRLGPCLNSTLWVRSSPGAFSNFFVGGSKVDPKLHPIHKGTCGDTIHSINTMAKDIPNFISPFIYCSSGVSYRLRTYFLAPPGRQERITLKREKNFGAGGITDNVTELLTEGQTDVEFEIVF